MEKVVKTIQTRNGGTVSLIEPDNGRQFFRYQAGSVATSDSFRYVIRQHGQEDTATVNIQVNLPQNNQNDNQKNFNNALKGFLNCADAFMDGSPGTQALTNLLGIDEGDLLNDDWMQKIFSSFRFIDYAKEAEALEFGNHIGHYHYSAVKGYWDYEPGGNSAVLHFPSSPQSEENDTEWIIDYIKTEPRKTESGFYHLPVAVSTELRVKGELLLAFKVNEISYLEGTAVPLYADIEAVAWPYVLQVSLKSQDQKEFFIRGTIKDQKGGCHVDVDTSWLVYQDLRDELDENYIHMAHGDLNINDISFTNLNSLWEAAKANIEDQQELDKLVKIDCLLKGKKIGDIRYIIKEEMVELTYLDGTRQNISDMVVEHFKRYFQEPKPTGEVRNNAFDLSAHTTYRASTIPVTTMADVRKKTTSNLTQAVRRRTIRNGVSFSQIGEVLARLFRVEETTTYNPYDSVYMPDKGHLTHTPDPGIINPGFKDEPVKPHMTEPKTTLITPEDKPRLTPKPGTIKSPEVTPSKTGTKTPVKPVSKDEVSIKATATPPKSTTIKPKGTTTIKPKGTSTVKAAATPVKPVSTTPKAGTSTTKKTSATGTKATTVKAPTTIKPVEGLEGTTIKPKSTTIKKTTRPK
ncbi:MAG: hypothetical protein Roseis2KO_44360 [Roseivirga sp.]